MVMVGLICWECSKTSCLFDSADLHSIYAFRWKGAWSLKSLPDPLISISSIFPRKTGIINLNSTSDLETESMERSVGVSK